VLLGDLIVCEPLDWCGLTAGHRAVLRRSCAWAVCEMLGGSELFWVTVRHFSCRMKAGLPLRLWRETILKRRRSWVLTSLINQVRKLD